MISPFKKCCIDSRSTDKMIFVRSNQRVMKHQEPCGPCLSGSGTDNKHTHVYACARTHIHGLFFFLGRGDNLSFEMHKLGLAFNVIYIFAPLAYFKIS